MARTDKNLQRTDESGPLMSEGPVPGIEDATPATLAAAVAEGKMLRRIHTLETGKAIRGRLIGRGASVEAKSPDGDMTPVSTWNFDVGQDITIGILGCHQLDTELPALVGRNLYVVRGEQKAVGNRRVNQYAVVDLDARKLGDAVPHVPASANGSAPSAVA
jgi:hypothetical protein